MMLRKYTTNIVLSLVLTFLCVVAPSTAGRSFLSATGSSVGVPVTMKAAGVTISEQPQNVTVAVGNTAKFKVTASGTSLTYQWQAKSPSATSWSNSTQSGAKTKELSVTTNVNHNGYQYRCVIKDASGTVKYSSAATLTVIPKITTQPANQRVLVGNTAIFSVAVTGKATLKYQWQAKAPNATSWSNSTQSGAKTAKLSVATNVNHNGYQYRCVVTDGNGKKAYSSAATLTIAPKITTQPKNTSAQVGNTATFSVAATGKATLTYQWQCKGPSETSWRNSSLSSAKNAKISIKTDNGYNGFQYRCVVTDGNGQKTYSSAATLTVTAKITTQPANVSVTAGTTAVFSVAAKGKATLKYQWQAKGPNATTWSASTQNGAKTAKLSVATTANHNGYQYRCVVTDGNGNQTISNAVTLTIIPKITTQPESKYVAVGTTVTFSVVAEGKGKLKYQWQYLSMSSSTWVNSQQTGARTERLSIKSTVNHQGYLYRCVVTDGNGSQAVSKEAMITLYNIPVTEQTIPNGVFREYVLSKFDTDGNEILDFDEIENAKEITVRGKGIDSLKGIEFFVKLDSLDCSSYTILTYTDTSNTIHNFSRLKGNTITSLNLRCNAELTSLDCSGNPLNELNVKWNTKLIRLTCRGLVFYDSAEKRTYDYRLTELDVSGNPSLQVLTCAVNRLSELDVSANHNLTGLDCSYNELSSLDLSGCPLLDVLWCYDNRLSSLCVDGCTKLRFLICAGNKLKSLDVSSNVAIQELECSFNELTTLDLSQNEKLAKLNCHGNGENIRRENYGFTSHWEDAFGLTDEDEQTIEAIISEITTESMNQIEQIKAVHDWMVCNIAYDMNFEQHDTSDTLNNHIAVCTGYASLYAAFMDKLGIRNLQVHSNDHIWNAVKLDDGKYYYVDCTHDDPLRNDSSDFPDGDNLSYDFFLVGTVSAVRRDNVYHVATNPPKQMPIYDFDWKTYLQHLEEEREIVVETGSIPVIAEIFPDSVFRQYILANFDLDKNKQLSNTEIKNVESMNLSDKFIFSLSGIGYFSELKELSCSGLRIKNLDVSKNAKLEVLICDDCRLERLDVSGCVSLRKLSCNENQLENLDLSKQLCLEELYCAFNQLMTLNVSSCPALRVLHCYTNNLTALSINNCINLQEVDCSYNQLTSLNVSTCISMVSLDCHNNQIGILDVSKCLEIEQLLCYCNQMTELSVTGCKNLELLFCPYNLLSEIDLDGCLALNDITCCNNRLTILDLSGCRYLNSCVVDSGVTVEGVDNRDRIKFID